MAPLAHTWTSPATAKINEFGRIQSNARYLGCANSPFFPKTAVEYAQHQAEFKNDMAHEEREKLGRKIEELAARKKGVAGVGELMRRLSSGVGEKEKEKKYDVNSTPSFPIITRKFVNDSKEKNHEEVIHDGGGGTGKEEDTKPYKVGYSKVLGLRTSVWAGDEQEFTEGKRNHSQDKQRAYWPCPSEFRAEGIGRINKNFFDVFLVQKSMLSTKMDYFSIFEMPN